MSNNVIKCQVHLIDIDVVIRAPIGIQSSAAANIGLISTALVNTLRR